MVKKNKIFSDVALFSGITVFLLFLSSFLPLASMLMPIPITILTIRRGSKISLFAILFIAVPVLLFVDAQLFLAVILITGLIGFMGGNAFQENYNGKKTFIIILFVALLGQTLYLGASYYILGSNVFLTFEQVLSDMVAEFNDPELHEVLVSVIKGALKIFPTFIFISGFLTALVNYYGLGYLAPRLNLSITPVLPFTNWRLPKSWSLILLIAGILYALTGCSPILNLALILSVILVALGSGVLWFKFRARISPTFKRFLPWLILLCLLIPTIGSLAMGLFLLVFTPVAFLAGLTDAWLNFRKL